jgi:hypothetical protein
MSGEHREHREQREQREQRGAWILLEITSAIVSHDELIENLVIRTGCFNSDDDDLFINLLKFDYASGKSLKDFLMRYKDDIINSIESEAILDKIESQNFLDSQSLISAEDIFRTGYVNRAFDSKAINNYILETRGEYIYQLSRTQYV